MPIGYKCLTANGITKTIVDMLRASVGKGAVHNERLLREGQRDGQLLYPEDRNFINGHYSEECSKLQDRTPILGLRAANATKLSNEKVLWPLGIVMYGVDQDLQYSDDLQIVEDAMRLIEMSGCVVFKKLEPKEVAYVIPRNLIWFGKTGADVPAFGFQPGNQSLSLKAIAHGAPAHTAHPAVMLLRILGLPMVSNRWDRDDFVKIHWRNVQQGKEHLFEKQIPVQILDPYDFDSILHAPANFACKSCDNGELTVEPVQDILWQRTLTMGHTNQLSPRDKANLDELYNQECTKYLPTAHYYK